MLDAQEYTILGKHHNVLGEETMLGRGVYSVQDKIRVRILHPAARTGRRWAEIRMY